MYEMRITCFPPLPEIGPENEAVVAAPRAEYLAPPTASVLSHGGSCRLGPAGSMGDTSAEQVELGVLMLRHIAEDLTAHHKRQHMRGNAGLN